MQSPAERRPHDRELGAHRKAGPCITRRFERSGPLGQNGDAVDLDPEFLSRASHLHRGSRGFASSDICLYGVHLRKLGHVDEEDAKLASTCCRSVPAALRMVSTLRRVVRLGLDVIGDDAGERIATGLPGDEHEAIKGGARRIRPHGLLGFRP